MSIKLELYKIFNQASASGSLSQAARELYMTQPAVSQAIMQLEEELGVRLFTRTPRGVVLTNEGHTLLEYTNSAVSLLDAGERKLKESRDLKEGELKIGVGDTTCRYYLLPYLEQFSHSYPAIKLKIINKTTEGLCALVKSGEINFAICNLPIKDPSLRVQQCKDIQDVFVGSSKYKEAASKTISYEELAAYPLIFLDTWSSTRQYVERYFLSRGIRITPEIELGSHDLLLELAKMGLGLACVVREFSEEYLKRGVLREIRLEEAIPPRAIGICSLKGVSLSPSAKRFVEYLVG